MVLATSVVSGCGGSDHAAARSDRESPSPTPSSSATPLPSAPTATAAIKVPRKDAKDAETSTRGFLTAQFDALAKPDEALTTSGQRALDSLVVGNALAQLIDQAKQLAASKQHVVGHPRVISAVVTHRTSTPPTMTVSACIDNSSVRVVSNDGKPVPGSTPQTRVRNILTLLAKGGQWLVADQTFADNPSC
jgi:hypothetical protein